MAFKPIKKAFEFCTKNPLILIYGFLNGAVGAIISLTLMLFILGGFGATSLLSGLNDPSALSNPAAFIALISSLMFAMLVTVFITTLIHLYFSAAAYRFIKTKNLRTSFNEALIVFPHMILAYIIRFSVSTLVFLAYGIGMAVTYILLGIITPFFPYILSIILFLFVMFLIGILGLRFVILTLLRLVFMDFLVCVGKKSAFEALKQSWHHSRNSRGHIFWNSLALYLLFFILLLPIQVIFWLVPFGEIFSGIISALLFPVYNVFFVYMYFGISETEKKKLEGLYSGGASEGIYTPPNAKQ
jgi:hypothetical protein